MARIARADQGVRRCPFDLPRRLVFSLALVGNLAQQAIFRPCEIRHLDHEFRLDPMDAGELQRRAEAALTRRRNIERHARSF